MSSKLLESFNSKNLSQMCADTINTISQHAHLEDKPDSKRASVMKFVAHISDQFNTPSEDGNSRGLEGESDEYDPAKHARSENTSDGKKPHSDTKSSTGFSLKNVLPGQKKKKDDDKKKDKGKGKNDSGQ